MSVSCSDMVVIPDISQTEVCSKSAQRPPEISQFVPSSPSVSGVIIITGMLKVGVETQESLPPRN